MQFSCFKTCVYICISSKDDLLIFDKSSNESATLVKSSAEFISKLITEKSLHFIIIVPPPNADGFLSTTSIFLWRSFKRKWNDQKNSQVLHPLISKFF